jgi:hypothetical protein
LIEKSSLTALGDIVRAYNETPDKEYSLAEITAQLKESSENFYNLFENGIAELRSETATSLKYSSFSGASISKAEPMDIYLPKVTTIPGRALYYNFIKNIFLPNLITIKANAFEKCTFRKCVYFPEVQTVEKEAFALSSKLDIDGMYDISFYFPKLETIGANAFNKFSVNIILKTMPTLSAIPEYWRAKVLVPQGMKADFEADTNWNSVISKINEATTYEEDATYWDGLIAHGCITEEEARAYYA